MSRTLNWGIISAGKISWDFVSALEFLPPGEHKVIAVAARKLEDAVKFATNFGIDHAYGTYDQVFNLDNVDVVYIGSVNSVHLELVLKALDAGKHVLCEKALAVNAREARLMIDRARDKKLFLMEAFWTKFFPIYAKLRDQLDNGSIGEPKFVIARQCGNPSKDFLPRLFQKETCGGAVLDMACYLVMFATWVFGGQKPVAVKANASFSESGVDETVCITLKYPGEKVASLLASYVTDLDGCADISGTNGYIHIGEPYHSPTFFQDSHGHHFKYPLPAYKDDQHINFTNSSALSYEAQCVRDCILAGLTECPKMPLDESLMIAEILDEVRKQIGLQYDHENQ